MKSYRDLIVWQKSANMVTLVYNVIKVFPDDEKFVLMSQIKKSSVSISSNIAEGYTRNYTKDYARFLQIAVNLDFISENDLDEIKKLSVEVEKMLNVLIKKILS